ncbi:hypothetical protein KIN20_011908 [Parelaphostrongylus tenuis]|uniref:Ankyrin repeat domain-containing protein n=1 Tax=Parelaphostrongylus tenuis TaxID=148309 RepID=A0AAD5MA43_PARTN|nr:hypothetical protein KIN20_011908 [Parelaphostrongylus tenuis]
MLPSDVCQIYKKGTLLRMNNTLADFNERRWERGDILFLFSATAQHESDELIIIDNNSKVFQRVRHEESEAEVDEEDDVLMSSDIVSAQMSTKTITFRQAFSGWLFKHAKEEQVGDYNVNFYLVDGMKLVSRKRRETSRYRRYKKE